MNDVVLLGRMARDPDVRYSGNENEHCTARFTVAVPREYKTDGQPDTDFISCVSNGKTAMFIEKYFHKGKPICVRGSIQTGSYTNKEGKKVYTTDVYVNKATFVPQDKQEENHQEKESKAEETGNAINDGFMQIPDGADDEGLPFN